MNLGKIVITLGVILILLGIFISFGDRIGFRIGRLPGDIYIDKGNFKFYFPITTSIIISIILTLIMKFLNK